MKNSFVWILVVILVFVLFIGVSIWFKNQSATNEPIPTLEISSADHVRGNGPVVIIEYSDFQCPACRAYFPIVEEIIAKRGKDIKFVYRHFPLVQHINAYPSALAAEAAGIQGKFFEMGLKLFDNQDKWASLSATEALNIFKQYATLLSLDVAKFELDYKDKTLRGRIQNDYKSGLKYDVNSTPTFFVNGEKLDFSNVQNLDDALKIFEASIDKNLGSQGLIQSATTTPQI